MMASQVRMLPLLLLLHVVVFLFATHTAAQRLYSVDVTRLLDTPLVASASTTLGSSPFAYNYNPAMFLGDDARIYVVVRCQNMTSKDPYSIGPSFLALTHFTNANFTQVAPLTYASVVFAPSHDGDKCGTEDPRITVKAPTGGDTSSTLFLTYTEYDCATPFLALATVPFANASDPAAWVRHGRLFDNTKSASILLRDPSHGLPHVMFLGGGVISVATSTDPSGIGSWKGGPDFISPRNNRFDASLVEGGPVPLRLSDGNLFYVYNSDEPGPNTPKPSWSTKYNCGFLILNGSNPEQILQRSDAPILSPELAWEVGVGSDGHATLTPEVVFCEGMVPLPNKTDEFLMVYGAADSYVGVATIRVTVPPPPWTASLSRLQGPSSPLLSSPNTSDFAYSYTPGLFLDAAGGVRLVPRVRNFTNGAGKPYDVSPSSLAEVPLRGPLFNWTNGRVTAASVVIAPSPELPAQACGVEDMRIALSPVDGKLHGFANEYDCATAHIAEFVADVPPATMPASWTRLGQVFRADASIGWSKAGSPLYRDVPPHFLFWGDNSDGKGLHVAVSVDGASWIPTDASLILTRPDAAGPGRTAFDASILEMGAPPVQLPDGNLFALYSGARNGVHSVRPGWDALYCVGFLILNGSNPLHVLQRSLPEAPLLCPQLPWEQADNTPPSLFVGQYPNRVVINGLVPLPGAGDKYSFLASYGAADAYSGSAVIRIGLPGEATQGRTPSTVYEAYAIER